MSTGMCQRESVSPPKSVSVQCSVRRERVKDKEGKKNKTKQRAVGKKNVSSQSCGGGSSKRLLW